MTYAGYVSHGEVQIGTYIDDDAHTYTVSVGTVTDSEIPEGHSVILQCDDDAAEVVAIVFDRPTAVSEAKAFLCGIISGQYAERFLAA